MVLERGDRKEEVQEKYFTILKTISYLATLLPGDALALLSGHHPAAGGGDRLAVLTLDLSGHSSADSLGDILAVLAGNSPALLARHLSRHLNNSDISIDH